MKKHQIIILLILGIITLIIPRWWGRFVSVAFFSPYTENDEIRRNNINYMFDVINFAIPGWDEAEQWLELGLSQDDTKTTYRNIDITFTTHFFGETVSYVLIDERE